MEILGILLGVSEIKEVLMATVLLAVIYAAFIGLGIPDSLFGAAWPAIYPDLGIHVSLASFYSVVSSLGSVVSSLFSARLIARFGTEKVAAVSTAMTALGLLAFSFGGGFWALCLCAIPLGLGAGAVDSAMNNYVAIHYNATQMSFLHCFYGVGVAVSPYLLGLALGQANDWRDGYRTMFCIQSVIAILLILTLPLWKKVERRSPEPEPEMRTVPAGQILKNPVARVSLAALFGSCSLEAMCLGWGSTWLVNSRGMDAAQGAQWITLYYVGMTLGRFFSGVVSRWLSPKKILAIGESITAVSVLLLFVPVPAAATIGLFGIGLGNGPVFPNMTYLTPIHFGQDVCQSFMGVQMTVTYGAFVLTPLLFSMLASTVSVGLFPVVCLIAMGLTALGTCLMVRRTRKEG